MENYIIYQDNIEINRIYSGQEFVAEYCAANGYTYAPERPPEPTLEEQIAALQAENARKDAQIAALSDYQDFHDELIAEMAAEVYK